MSSRSHITTLAGGAQIAGGAQKVSTAARRALAALAVSASVLGAVLSITLLAPSAHAQTVRYVDDDAGCEGQRPCYQTIQAAVDAAADGDILSIAPGVYTETVIVVDKGLRIEGPGTGTQSGVAASGYVPNGAGGSGAGEGIVTATEAIWSAPSQGEAALTFDARTTDIANSTVTGLAIVSSSVGIRLVGRRAGDPLPLPPGLPSSTVSTTVSGTVLNDLVFSGTPLAIDSRYSDRLEIERVAASGGGITVTAGNAVRLANNVLRDAPDAAIRLLVDGDNHEVVDNLIVGPHSRGIDVLPLTSAGGRGSGRHIRLAGNRIEDPAAEGIFVGPRRTEPAGSADHDAGGAGPGRSGAEARTLSHAADDGLVDPGKIRGADGPGDAGVAAVAALRQISITGGSLAGAGPDASLPSGQGFLGAVAVVGSKDTVADVLVESLTVTGTHLFSSTLSVGAGVYLEGVGGTAVITGVNVTHGEGDGITLVDAGRARLFSSSVSGNDVGVRIIERAPALAGSGDVVLGGQAELGNRLVGNGVFDLVLENDTGSSVSTADVDATFNYWGVAYGPEIEDLVHHRTDSVVLGLVDYLPALGVPTSAHVAVEPPSLVADGESEAQVTLSAFDVLGEDVADGALVQFENDMGDLTPAADTVEAEDEEEGLTLSGEWGVFDSEVFGPFSGDGYVRSYQAGAQLVWNFKAPAVLARYGQAVLHDGRFRVDVDGREVGTFSTRGPGKTWVERLLASGLGSGAHVLTITVEAGEVNIDVLYGGAATVDGSASATLRSGNETGVCRLRGSVHGALGTRLAETDVPFTAGHPAALTVTLGTSVLPVGGFTTTVAVDARDQAGRPVPDGTEVTLSTDVGTVSPDKTVTVRGRALSVLTSGDSTGRGFVRASASGAFASVPVTLTAGPPATLDIDTTTGSLAANSRDVADLRITVRDRFGHRVVDGTAVHVETTLGEIVQPDPLVERGSARTALIAGNQIGTAVVRASAGDAASQIEIEMFGTDIRLIKRAEPHSAVVPGEQVTFTLTYDNVGSGTVYDLLIDDVLPTGLISPVVQISPGQQLTRLEDRPLAFVRDRMWPGEQGTITVSLRVDTSMRWGSRTEVENRASAFASSAAELTPGDNESLAEVVVVSGDVYSVTMQAPEQLAVGGATGVVRVTLTDRFGNPARDGTVVAFSTDLGRVEPLVAETTDGVAQTTFTTGTKAGIATLRAITVDERGAQAQIRVLPGAPARLSLVPDRQALRVGGETTVITASVVDHFANGVAGVTVTLVSDNGLLTPERTRTGASGVATATLRSSVHTATAHVEARAGRLYEALEIPFEPGPVAGVSLSLDRSQARVGDNVFAEAAVVDEYGNPIPDTTVGFECTVGTPRDATVQTDSRGLAATLIRVTKTGAGLVVAAAGARTDSRQLTVVSFPVFLPLASR